MENLQTFVDQLTAARTTCANELQAIDTALAALNGTPGTARRATNGNIVVMQRRTMSTAARARIRAAQKARWAKWRTTQRRTQRTA